MKILCILNHVEIFYYNILETVGDTERYFPKDFTMTWTTNDIIKYYKTNENYYYNNQN